MNNKTIDSFVRGTLEFVKKFSKVNLTEEVTEKKIVIKGDEKISVDLTDFYEEEGFLKPNHLRKIGHIIFVDKLEIINEENMFHVKGYIKDNQCLYVRLNK
jgi:hypothetical protein